MYQLQLLRDSKFNAVHYPQKCGVKLAIKIFEEEQIWRILLPKTKIYYKSFVIKTM